MDFKTVDELKEFLIWAKLQKIKTVDISEHAVKIEFSELAHIESFPDMSNQLDKPDKNLATAPSSSKLPDGQAALTEDEQLLYWSTR
jgi:hypothetical protein